MALVASIILSLALNYDLEPKVQWVFSARACEFCNGKQIEIMARFFEIGDEILVSDADEERAGAEKLESHIRALFPDIQIRYEAGPFATGVTGWVWNDSFTGETISYQSKTGKYGDMRVRSILALFRDPKTAKTP